MGWCVAAGGLTGPLIAMGRAARDVNIHPGRA